MDKFVDMNKVIKTASKKYQNIFQQFMQCWRCFFTPFFIICMCFLCFFEWKQLSKFFLPPTASYLPFCNMRSAFILSCSFNGASFWGPPSNFFFFFLNIVNEITTIE